MQTRESKEIEEEEHEKEDYMPVAPLLKQSSTITLRARQRRISVASMATE